VTTTTATKPSRSLRGGVWLCERHEGDRKMLDSHGNPLWIGCGVVHVVWWTVRCDGSTSAFDSKSRSFATKKAAMARFDKAE